MDDNYKMFYLLLKWHCSCLPDAACSGVAGGGAGFCDGGRAPQDNGPTVMSISGEQTRIRVAHKGKGN